MEDIKALIEDDENAKKHVEFYRKSNACWRCVLMLLKLSSKTIDLTYYRQNEVEFSEGYGVPPLDGKCSVCLGLL